MFLKLIPSYKFGIKYFNFLQEHRYIYKNVQEQNFFNFFHEQIQNICNYIQVFNSQPRMFIFYFYNGLEFITLCSTDHNI